MLAAVAECSRVLVHSSTSAREARRLVDQVMRSWSFDGEVADNATLIVSELVTNAIQATNFGSRISVLIRRSLDGVVIGVQDHSEKMPAIRTTTEELEDGGRGLVIVHALAARVWTEKAPNGKWVYALLSCPTQKVSPRAAITG